MALSLPAGMSAKGGAPAPSRLSPPVASLARGALRALRAHWREYLIEALLLGTFMVSACLFVALLEHGASPLRQALASGDLRRALIGVAMGLTAVALIYSPLGKRSGAHMNPAVTLTFWRLGKIDGSDALFYVLAQFAGGVAGVVLSAWLLGAPVIADASVNYAVTVPGAHGPLAALVAEAAISFGLMLTVLVVSNRPALNRYTGLIAGALVATYITVEAPLSGMSMNPARTLGSALPAQVWSGWWLYFIGPTLGMLAAAELYVRAQRAHPVLCCKLHHDNPQPCIFNCAYPH